MGRTGAEAVGRSSAMLARSCEPVARRLVMARGGLAEGSPDLADLISHQLPGQGMVATALPRLSLFRADTPTAPLPAVYEASVCLIAQGAKRVALGEEVVTFDAAHHLVVSLDLPLVGHVTDASHDRPYLCCKIDFDLRTLADMVIQMDDTDRRGSVSSVLTSCPSDPELIDAACRLITLLDRPREAAMLAPLVEREILCRLLLGPHGREMRRVAAADSHLARIARAVAHIRQHLDMPVRIEQLAALARMGSSSFHRHFKAVTRMTPIEYQKQLRLQEARRLMLACGINASNAAFAVGYESPSQFSREYARMFGAAPSRDVRRAHEAGGMLVAA